MRRDEYADGRRATVSSGARDSRRPHALCLQRSGRRLFRHQRRLRLRPQTGLFVRRRRQFAATIGARDAHFPHLRAVSAADRSDKQRHHRSVRDDRNLRRHVRQLQAADAIGS